MRSNILLSILFLAMISLQTSAQTTDLASVEYLHLPVTKSINSFSPNRALALIPLDKENENLLIVGLECQFLVIDIKDEEDICVFIDHLLSSVQQMNAYIGYVWIDIGHWNFGLKAGMGLAVGDYPDNSLEGKKPYRFIIGRTYSKLINYPKRFHVNWTYTLEVPKTNLRHYLNENNKDAIQAFATLDDVFSHIQYSFVKRSSSQNPDEKWRKVFKKPLLS